MPFTPADEGPKRTHLSRTILRRTTLRHSIGSIWSETERLVITSSASATGLDSIYLLFLREGFSLLFYYSSLFILFPFSVSFLLLLFCWYTFLPRRDFGVRTRSPFLDNEQTQLFCMADYSSAFFM